MPLPEEDRLGRPPSRAAGQAPATAGDTERAPSAAPPGRLRRAWSALREIAWGLVLYDTYHETKVEARRHQDAFDLLILGEMLGIPLMNTTVGLRLLPYAVGGLERFKTRFLEEPEILNEAPHIH